VNLDRLKPRERRVVALGLLLALLMIVIFALLIPYVARYGHYLNAIEDQQFRLERLHAAAAQLPALEAEIRALRVEDEVRRHLLEQDTPSLAAAQVQALVGRTVAAHGGEVRSMQVGRPLDEQGFTRVSVTVRMATTGDELADLFADLESRRPLMFVDNVQIRLLRQRTRRRGPAQETGEVEVDFDLQAYMREARS
jgi:general secretion pathway protein M